MALLRKLSYTVRERLRAERVAGEEVGVCSAVPCRTGGKGHAGARAWRFLRGYLMIVGALTTLYVLAQLLVLLFVEIARWMPPQP